MCVFVSTNPVNCIYSWLPFNFTVIQKYTEHFLVLTKETTEKSRKLERVSFFLSSCDVTTNLDSQELECPFKLESYVLLVPFNSKVPNVLMRENLAASLACKSMRKMAISCTFTGHTASAVLGRNSLLLFSGNKKWLWDKIPALIFFSPLP